MSEFPSLSNKEAFILSYLIRNPRSYGLAMVKGSEGRLKRGTAYVTLHRMEEKGYIRSSTEAIVEGEVGPSRRVYEITAKGAQVFKAWQMFVAHLSTPVIRS